MLKSAQKWKYHPNFNDCLTAIPFDVNNFAVEFVEKTMIKVMKIIKGMNDGATKEELRAARFTSSLNSFNVKWPTRGYVNPQNALESLNNQMRAWNQLPELKEWMFHIIFVHLDIHLNSEVYTYEVIWSIPTAAYPEPQVTVKIYFHVTAYLHYLPHYPLEVTYVFEGHQFIHYLDMEFRPKWLYDVLDMKTMMFKSFDF